MSCGCWHGAQTQDQAHAGWVVQSGVAGTGWDMPHGLDRARRSPEVVLGGVHRLCLTSSGGLVLVSSSPSPLLSHSVTISTLR